MPAQTSLRQREIAASCRDIEGREQGSERSERSKESEEALKAGYSWLLIVCAAFFHCFHSLHFLYSFLFHGSLIADSNYLKVPIVIFG